VQRRVSDFLGIKIDVLGTEGLFYRLVDFVEEGGPRKVMYLNAHCAVIAKKDLRYKRVLNRSDLVYADGMSIVWGARLLGARIPERSTGADFLPNFCEGFAERGYRIYFLGSEPGIAEKAAGKLRERIPNLQIVGTHHGFFTPEEEDRVLEDIARTKPHILIVGMGVPYQEQWIDVQCERLNVPVIWGVGALFDFISGELTRGPQWLVDNGFEWLCRLCVEPGRLWQRYLVGNMKFAWYLFSYKMCKRNGSSRPTEIA